MIEGSSAVTSMFVPWVAAGELTFKVTLVGSLERSMTRPFALRVLKSKPEIAVVVGGPRTPSTEKLIAEPATISLVKRPLKEILRVSTSVP